jgi:hypothetical protein
MIGVAVLALVFASIWIYLPWLRWRMRVNRIVDEKLAAREKRPGLFSTPSYKAYNKLTAAEYRDVLKDPRYVAERLLEISANDADPRRRKVRADHNLLGSTGGTATAGAAPSPGPLPARISSAIRPCSGYSSAQSGRRGRRTG